MREDRVEPQQWIEETIRELVNERKGVLSDERWLPQTQEDHLHDQRQRYQVSVDGTPRTFDFTAADMEDLETDPDFRARKRLEISAVIGG